MRTRVISRKGLVRKIRIDCDPEEVRPLLEGLTAEYRREAQLPGFRRGQAPARVVAARFAKDIREDAVSRLIDRGIQEASRNHELDIAGILRVDAAEITSEDRFWSEVSLEVVPMFKIPPYKGIKVEIGPLPDEAELVERQIQELREMAAQYEKTDGAAALGDMVRADCEGICDGRSLAQVTGVPAELSGGDNLRLTIDPARGPFPSEFYQAIQGIAAGERRQVEVHFAQEPRYGSLGGKRVTYFVHAREVYRRKIPAADDAGARQMGFRNLQDLRQFAQKNARLALDAARRAHVEREVIKHLLSAVKFEVPAVWLRVELLASTRELAGGLGPVPDGDEVAGKKWEDLAVGHAFARARLKMILHRIAQEEKIEPSQDELLQAIAELAARSRLPRRQYMRMLRREGGLTDIYQRLRNEKALRLVVDHALVEEKQD
ncbi:MAG TPA: trigger factor [Kiritimatiellae bacterium]|nr:trigger factor [Kiritimatiellia bacterium]